jgi:uncharacterized hydantoinase/oxoprolinase family protein
MYGAFAPETGEIPGGMPGDSFFFVDTGKSPAQIIPVTSSSLSDLTR